MLALPPPSKDHPLNPVNNTHANVAPFHHQQYTASHFAKRVRSNDNDDDDAVIVHHYQQHHGTVIQKKPKHRHHDDTRGLRHFSKQVCDTVARKGITTYSEVADELASSIRANGDNAGCTITSFDQKNIRRRVYDALNVLMGTGIIAKDKKNIKWVGDIACTDEHAARKMHDQHLVNLQAQIHREQVHQATLITSLDEMSHLIRDKLQQHVQLCHLVWKNQQRNDESTPPDHARVGLPFFLVSSLDGHDMQIQVQDDGTYEN
ncbi:hypothetical protein K492DRAFT_187694 [Lichtheimia hyalospora FSU 10163]|nr:hypothetical protein K492DRAFT_187694 [Lichtheimia hyalospora FSU 10163]